MVRAIGSEYCLTGEMADGPQRVPVRLSGEHFSTAISGHSQIMLLSDSPQKVQWVVVREDVLSEEIVLFRAPIPDLLFAVMLVVSPSHCHSKVESRKSVVLPLPT